MAHEPEEPPHDPEEEEGGPVKSFLEHLEDLRWTIIKSGSALVVAMIVCLLAAPVIVDFLQWPMQQAKVDGLPIADMVTLDFLSPLGPIMTTLKLAFYTGLVLGLPFILYYIGEFVVPALKAKEKKYFFTAFTIGTGFFLGGVITCYFYILPISLQALIKYNQWLGVKSEIWRAEDFYEFVTKFLLGVGLLFEVPVLILTLVKLEIIEHKLLVRGRKYMFVANFAFCAILTPADLFTTFMMAVALQIVYEGCILISAYWDRQRRRRLAAETGLATTSHSDQVSSAD